MAYDLVIRNGMIVDGSGLAPYRADVGIIGDRIARLGRINDKGAEEIDAEGHAVTPGFIDGHTHMDAQLFWDPYGTSSCWHGVTSVVMGNCGFTLAPSRPGAERLVIQNLERAEDIPPEAIAAGIEWSWQSFPEYLDAVDAVPKAINYAAQIGHSALRTFAMGERAFSEQASSEDLSLMRSTLREAVQVGAIGFSSSLAAAHLTADDRPVASRIASWEELCSLVEVMGEEGAGFLQIASPSQPEVGDEAEMVGRFYRSLMDLAVATRVPTTYGIVRRRHIQLQLDILDQAAAAGGRMFGQSRSVATSLIFSFKSQMPYDRLPVWSEFRALPLEDQLSGLRDPSMRKRLVDAVDTAYSGGGATALTSARRPEPMAPFSTLLVMRDGEKDISVEELAKQRNVAPIDCMLDLIDATNLEQVFGRFAGYEDPDLILMMKHPRTVMTFSDSGAHVSYHSGAELQTTMLEKWVRDRELFSLEEAVRMMTLVPALAWGLSDRGLLRENMIADINVFDPKTVGLRAPTIESDLPAGAKRVKQKATGYLSTVVSGKETLRKGEHTGALSGQLIRGPLAAAC